MTTTRHTALPFGGPLTSAAMEAPLSQLDTAIVAVEGDVTQLFASVGSGAGWASTLDGTTTAAVDEQQTVTITGTPTGGTFTLTFDGQTTAAIAYNAAAAAVVSALVALSNIGPTSVTATGGALPGTAVVVTFGVEYAGTDVPQMTAAGSFTGGVAPAVAVTTTRAGVSSKVVPVASTTGAVAGMPVYIGLTSGTHEVGVIDTISAGVSVTLVANLASTYNSGAPISATPAEVADARGGYATLGAKVRGRGIDVRDYAGADPTGAADSSAAIQAAVTAAGATAFTVIPAGSWKFRDVALPSGSRVTLDPAALCVPGTGATGASSFFTAIGTAGAHLANVGVSGGRFDGGSVMQQAIKADYVDELTVTGAYGEDFVGAVAYVNRSTDVAIRDLRALRCHYNVALDGSSFFTVSGCRSKGMIRDGILVYNGSSFGTVSGNVVDDFATGGETGRAGIHVYGSSDVTVTGNVVRTSHPVSGTAGLGIRFRDSNRWTCSGNLVSDIGTNGIDVTRVGDFAGLDGGDGTIVGNTVIDCGYASGAAINVGYALNRPVTVSGNRILRSLGDGITIAAPNCIVTGNDIETTVGHGINVSGSAATIASNRVEGVPTAKSGIFVSGTGEIIRDNGISDALAATSYGIRIYTGGSASLEGNVVTAGVSAKYYIQGTVLPFERGGDYGESYGTAAPVSGTWRKGDRVINTSVAAAGYIGWVCTVAGTPGTWKGYGLIQA